MNVNKSLVAAAVASALAAGTAFASPPSSPPTVWIYAGGGSAQANAIEWAILQQLNNVDSYTDGACGVQSGNFRILTGTPKTAIGSLTTSTVVGVMYRFKGGSWPNGGAAFATPGTKLGYPATTTIPTATTCSNSSFATNGLPTYTINTSSFTNNQVPAFGVTDEEVALFNVAFNLPPPSGLSYDDSPGTPVSTLNNIAIDGIYDNLIGIAVTNTLYAQKTNFSRAEVAGILSGQISDWGQLRGDNGSALAAGPIVLLDRGAGSGTKAAGSQYFLNYPGGLATGGYVFPASANYGYSGDQNSGGGFAPGTFTAGALTAAQLTAGNYLDIAEGSSGNVVADLKTAQANSVRAIAVLGMEFPPGGNQVAGANVYSFVKINGVGVDTGVAGDNINSPHGNGSCTASGGLGPQGTKYTNAINGSYDFYFQNSFNTSAYTNTNNPAGSNGVAFATAMKNSLQSVAVAGANASLGFPSAVPGLLMDAAKASLTASSQQTGVPLFSRLANSMGPLQVVYDATTGLAPTAYGCDPL